VAIPITIKQTPLGRFLVVKLAVGGGKPVPVLLDTGFPFLYMLSGAIGPHVSYGPTVHPSVFGHPFVGRAATASVTLEGSQSVTTPRPIQLLATSSLILPALKRYQAQLGIQGDIGIGQLFPGFFSPLVQLAPPLSDGFTIALNAPGGPQLLLGKPAKTASSASVPLLGPSTPGIGGPQEPARYPNGMPTHTGFFNLCWRIAGKQACGLTNADTGNPSSLLPQALLPNLPHISFAGSPIPFLASGLSVTISTPAPGSRIVRTYTTSQPPAGSPAYLPPPQGAFGTGLGLYIADEVGYDMVDGQLIITPG
jgi:hypothetical protein